MIFFPYIKHNCKVSTYVCACTCSSSTEHKILSMSKEGKFMIFKKKNYSQSIFDDLLSAMHYETYAYLLTIDTMYYLLDSIFFHKI